MENVTNITKIPNGLTISGKNYVFTGDATIINDTSAHIVTDQGIIYVDTSSTVENRNFADINELLTNVNFRGTKHNPPELTLLSSEFTQAQANAIAINSAKVGIASARVTSGNLTISLTDGTTPINSVNVVGPTGPTGPTGPAGPSGSNSVGGGGGGGVHQLTKPISNVRYSSRLSAGGVYSTSAGPPNQIRLAPFIPANSITIKNLIGTVNGGVVGGLFRLLVYSDLNGVPSSKLIETTSLNGNTWGDLTYIVSFTFTAGTTYWLGAYTNLTGINIPIYSDQQSITLGAESGFRDYMTRVIAATFPNAPATLGATTLSINNPYSINFTAV